MARILYQGEPYKIKILLPDLDTITHDVWNMWKIKDTLYVYQTEPLYEARLIAIKTMTTWSRKTSNLIDKQYNYQTVPPTHLIQLVFWKSDSSKTIYVAIPVVGLDASGYIRNVIPKPDETDAVVIGYVGRIVGLSGTINGPYIPYVCFDQEFNFADCETAGIMTFTSSGGYKIHAPTNADPVTIAIVIMAIAGAIAVGGMEAYSHIQHAEAEKLQAMSDLEKARMQQENIKVISETIKYLWEQTQDKDVLIQAIQSFGLGQAYMNSFMNNPPSTNDEENPSKNESWWSGIIDFLKNSLPLILGIIGLVIVLFKFNVIVDVFRRIGEMFRRR